MRALIKVMIVLGLVFTTTFILGRVFGLLTVDHVRHWLEIAQNTNPIWVAAAIIILLFVDIFIAVPTLALTIMAGYFLGFPLGAVTAFTGMACAAATGYGLSRIWGQAALSKIIRDESQRHKMATAFETSGPVMIVFARAVPMLPEVTACMAGVTRMPVLRYSLLFVASTLPYALLAAYAGSISSADSPQPAIYAALVLYAILWTGWYIFNRRTQKKRKPNAVE